MSTTAHAPVIAVAGTGSCLPHKIITTEDIGGFEPRPRKDARWGLLSTGVLKRHFRTGLNEPGPVHKIEQLDMSILAAKRALWSAGIEGNQLDKIIYVSCTQMDVNDLSFSRSAMVLSRELGLRRETMPREQALGCGGAVHLMMDTVDMMLGNPNNRYCLVIGASAPSVDWAQNHESYNLGEGPFSKYIFGDGAGAIILHRSEDVTGSRIMCSYGGHDALTELMAIEPVVEKGKPIFHIYGKRVAAKFSELMSEAFDGLRKRIPADFDLTNDVKRFYFHQVSGEILYRFVAERGLPMDKVAVHIEDHGNTAAAATLILLDEEIKKGIVGPGDYVVLCAVGAGTGAQFGAILMRL